MKILHHGAVQGVTGSCHELRLNGSAILVDCGLFQGAETSGQGASANSLAIDFAIEHIKALIVSHVHIDHVGRIPYLLAAGFSGPIYCSEASAVLLPLVLEDALKVGFTRNKRLIAETMKVIHQRIRPLVYGRWQEIDSDNPGQQLAVKLQPAGHILGSAYVQCRITDRQTSVTKRQHRVLFSGDLGAPYAPLLPAPKSPYGTDTLVIESTYGDRLHDDRRSRRRYLKQVIEKAVSDKGVVLIPAFSIGRTQELLYELEAIIDAGPAVWQAMEIILDSPLAAKFTEAYKQLQPFWDAEARQRINAGRHPLDFDQLYTVNTHTEHLQTVDYLQRRLRPAIVIAASGMCAGGRIVNYLKAFIEDRRSDVIFIGYQAAGTAGQVIQRYAARHGYVELDGQRYTINAAIHSLGSYSAHADQQDLLNFVKRMRKKPSEIRIVHGDEQAKRALRDKLQVINPEAEIIIPEQ